MNATTFVLRHHGSGGHCPPFGAIYELLPLHRLGFLIAPIWRSCPLCMQLYSLLWHKRRNKRMEKGFGISYSDLME